jgi:glycosyltransferase involved in cell wall biosynthesis
MGQQYRIHITFPVLNEEAQLADAVARTVTYCNSNGVPIYQLCVADNGSTDRTPQIGGALAERYSNLRYLRLPERGFGLALKSAWADSDADFVGYMDVDLATDLRHLKDVYKFISGGAAYDLYLGSRLKQGSSVKNRSLLRGLTSRVFNQLLHWRLGVSFSDAMCGFKFINRDLYNSLIDRFDFTDDWFFATQLAVRAEWMGAKILDMPVAWTDQPNSKSSARLLNLSLIYLSGISQLSQEMRRAGSRNPRRFAEKRQP